MRARGRLFASADFLSDLSLADNLVSQRVALFLPQWAQLQARRLKLPHGPGCVTVVHGVLTVGQRVALLLLVTKELMEFICCHASATVVGDRVVVPLRATVTAV